MPSPADELRQIIAELGLSPRSEAQEIAAILGVSPHTCPHPPDMRVVYRDGDRTRVECARCGAVLKDAETVATVLEFRRERQ